MRGTLCGLPALGREGQEVLPDADWPVAQSVLRAAAASGCSSLSFWVHKAGPESWDSRTFCVGSVARLCTGPGSLQPQAAALGPSRAGQALSRSLCALPGPGQGVGHRGLCPLGTRPAPLPARGLLRSLPLPGGWAGVQPDPGAAWDTRGLPLDTEPTLGALPGRGHSAEPGGAPGLGAAPAPHTKRQSLGCVRVTRPAPARPGGAVNVTMPCNAATGATCQ